MMEGFVRSMDSLPVFEPSEVVSSLDGTYPRNNLSSRLLVVSYGEKMAFFRTSTGESIDLDLTQGFGLYLAHAS